MQQSIIGSKNHSGSDYSSQEGEREGRRREGKASQGKRVRERNGYERERRAVIQQSFRLKVDRTTAADIEPRMVCVVYVSLESRK